MAKYINLDDVLEMLNDIGGCGAPPGSYYDGWDAAIYGAYNDVQSIPTIEFSPSDDATDEDAHGRNIISRTIIQNGSDHEIIVAIEEMAELQQALTKWLRYHNSGCLENLAEEMADVGICMEMLDQIFGNSDDVSEWREKKISRLESRLKKEEHHEYE